MVNQTQSDPLLELRESARYQACQVVFEEAEGGGAPALRCQKEAAGKVIVNGQVLDDHQLDVVEVAKMCTWNFFLYLSDHTK